MFEDAADDARPVLKVAHRARARWTAGVDPGADERERGGDEFAAVRRHPHAQIRMPEASSEPGTLDTGVKADAYCATGDLIREGRVVTSDDPGASDRDAHHV